MTQNCFNFLLKILACNTICEYEKKMIVNLYQEKLIISGAGLDLIEDVFFEI